MDYNTAAATATINVDKATPTITWANPADITYGTALSATQLDATASVPGTFSYTPASGTVLDAGNGQTLSVSFTPTDITDYTTPPPRRRSTLIRQRPPSPGPIPPTSPTARRCPPPQLDATASVPGTFTYTPAAGTVLHAGDDQTLSVSFTPTDTDRLHHGHQRRRSTSTKATPSITWANPADITYGTAPVGHPARCDRVRARHVHLHAGLGDGAACG